MSNMYINEPTTSGKVCLHTSAGDIEVELWAKECPLAARNFIQLCMEGYYNGTIFHRLVKNFIVQGGDPSGTGQGGESIYGKPFKDEFHQRLRFSRRGLLGMANAGKDDNSSQFFFTIGTEPARDLDKKHTLFGKITGPTLFNMLKMTETDTDSNDRPLTVHKIVKTTVLTNPFDDMKPREKEKRKKDSKKEKKSTETKKLNLLSFGDEAEEDEMELVQVNKKLNVKGKSAHDVLEDERLSKQVAVTKDEMAHYQPEEDDHDPDAADRIRAKFAKKRKLNDKKDDDKEDEDLDEMIANAKKDAKKKELELMSSELKSLQKEYVKALRGPKEEKEESEEDESTVLKEYKEMKLKFKSKTKKLLSKKDADRESQTMKLLERFKTKLDKVDQEAILFDKKVTDLPERMDLSEKAEEREREDKQSDNKDNEKQYGIDLDAEDEAGTDWMNHTFVAEDDDPNVTKAKDANLREESEDWYDMTDPRNKMNKRKRGDIDT